MKNGVADWGNFDPKLKNDLSPRAYQEISELDRNRYSEDGPWRLRGPIWALL